MHGLCASTCKASVAILALERFGTGVNIFMLAQLGIVSEAFAAYITLEFSIVDGSVFAVHVPRHFPSSHHFTTFRTWNLDVDPINVFLQIIRILESGWTMWANQLGRTMHCIHMLFQVVDMRSAFFANFFTWSYLVFQGSVFLCSVIICMMTLRIKDNFAI